MVDAVSQGKVHTPLLLLVKAIDDQNLDRINDLLAQDNELVNSPMVSSTTYPLHVASMGGNKIIIETLVRLKAELDCRMDGGATAISVAAQLNKVSSIQTLVNLKADPNSGMDQGTTPLFLASQKGHVQVIHTLVEAKVDINSANGDLNATAVSIAATHGHIEALKALSEHNADMEHACMTMTDPDNGEFLYSQTPLSIAAMSSSMEPSLKVETLSVLAELKGDVNHVESDLMSPLMYSVLAGCHDSIEALYALKADMNQGLEVERKHITRRVDPEDDENKETSTQEVYTGKSPLYIATLAGQASVLRTLLALSETRHPDKCLQLANRLLLDPSIAAFSDDELLMPIGAMCMGSEDVGPQNYQASAEIWQQWAGLRICDQRIIQEWGWGYFDLPLWTREEHRGFPSHLRKQAVAIFLGLATVLPSHLRLHDIFEHLLSALDTQKRCKDYVRL